MESRQAPHPDPALEETLESLSNEPVSQGAFADLCYPKDLTRRIADRVLRDSFEQAFRAVAHARAMRPASGAMQRPPAARYPALRGADELGVELESQEPAIAREIGAILASKGVLYAACHAIGAGRPSLDRSCETLINAGVPLDLVAHALGQPRDLDAQTAAARLIHAACATSQSTQDACDRLLRESKARPWIPTIPGATLRSDAGDAPCAVAVVSLAREDYLFDPGDGGALDHVRACVSALAPTPTLILAHDPDRVHARLGASHARFVRCTQPPAQFIRDAACVLRNDPASSLLLPRFPSRGEIGTMHAPDLLPCATRDLAASLGAIMPGATALHSPLHFHGGDVLCWHDADGAHALVGESTIARNTAMGLTQAQVRDALAREFNAVELIVLPAATFHVDTCVSVVRTLQGTAFLVADPLFAAAHIIDEACERLRAARVLSPAAARQITTSLARRNEPSNAIAYELLARSLGYLSVPGATPLPALLAPTDPDGGAASAMRFLHAVDVLGAASGPIPVSPDLRSYLNSLQRAMADLDALKATLEPHGRIVPFAAGITGPPSIPAINMVHSSEATTLMPTFGGVCTRADQANQATLERHLNRRVIRIPSSETAIRQGAARCSLVLLG